MTRHPANQKSPPARRAQNSPDRPPGFGWLALLACAVIILAGLAAYSNSFHGPFIFDDVHVVNLPSATKLWPIWPTLTGSRPVVQASLALNHTLGGPGETGYHVFNVIVHLLAALALFGIVRRTLLQCRLPIARERLRAPRDCRMETEKEKSTTNAAGRDRLSVHSSVIPHHSAIGNRQSEIALALGFCVALLWALHPLQTEAVTYIIQRMESLMGLFYLLTLYCVIRAATSRHSGAWHAAAVAACALGMGCKEVMVTAPVVVLLYDRAFIGGSFRETLRRRWGLYLALAVTWLIVLPMLLYALFGSGAEASAGLGMKRVTPLLYAQSQFGVILRYLQLAFWPTGLCLDYFWPIAHGVWEIAPGAIVVGILLAATVWASVRWPRWGFMGAFFFLVLAPTSSIMPIVDLAFEHRMYLPLAALAAAVVIAAFLLVKRLGLGLGALLFLCAAAAVALGMATHRRNADYQSAMRVYEDTAAKNPNNPRALVSLGWAKIVAGDNDEALRQRYYDEALKCLDKALTLPGDDAWAYNYRGLILQKRHQNEEALKEFDKAVKAKPTYADAYLNRCNSYNALGRFQDALNDCNQAIKLDPLNPGPYNNRGLAYSGLHNYEKALDDYQYALTLNPNQYEAYFNEGLVYAAMGQDEPAIRAYSRCIASKPKFPDAYHNRALIYDKLKRYAETLKDLDKVVELNPDYPSAYYSRAIFFFEIKEFDKALADVEACEKYHGNVPAKFREDVMKAAGKR